MRKNKLMIVAHPDDEVIFAGNRLMYEKDWKVICVTNGSNPVRRQEFEKVMHLLKIKEYEIWDYEDIWKGDFDRNQLKKDIKKILEERDYEMVVTHSKNGEYGHTQHQALFEIMNEIVSNNLYSFTLGNKNGMLKRLKKWMVLMKYKSERRVIMSKEVRQYIECEALIKIK